MNTNHTSFTYEAPLDIEILEAYMNKNEGYKRTDARRLRRALRKLRYAQ